MKKIMGTIILVLLVGILLTGYIFTEKSTQEPPEVKITIGDKELDYVIGKNQWNGDKYDRECTLKSILEKTSESEIPYVKIDDIVTISFKNNPPNKLTILDILIDNRGNQIYSDKETVSIPVQLKHGKCSFKIAKHFASGLSSYYSEEKTDIRGFKIIANWGGKWENECEYGFVIKTDSF
ncbi:hypothetical protein [Oceanirhabdus sp. W0125-5]|uniref:hypothetical protein n=1 Tax=Oceanirhabdus sp. W0125-5 TaxID=2999116 RepID=UPI0022F2B708|nr:hypothetical protein [Oceanirhabdus sp. W0125-5]WBW96411.1 hypothetical protein OW730_22355 [Oceanirhabdus sp. W0125-5]